eukprot:TRINITY_DN12873_c0_g3_i1.p1 TRINITY_DN12873_c0_g3~~TRINITY_DN12873_c0_g3_i1.p1  ORF type:complete len:2048 (-),score=360.55 TRINITY_DN12873_c0_g3_i1:129-6272(-)
MIATFLVTAIACLASAKNLQPKGCPEGVGSCQREADFDELEFLQVNTHRAAMTPHGVAPASAVHASILQKIGQIHGENLNSLQEAEGQLRDLVRKEKKGCCDPILASVDKLLETAAPEARRIQDQLNESTEAAFEKCEVEFAKATLVAESAARLRIVKDLGAKAEACAGQASLCAEVVSFTVDVMADTDSEELKAAAQSLAKAAAACKASRARQGRERVPEPALQQESNNSCSQVLSAKDAYVEVAEKNIRDAWEAMVKKNAAAKSTSNDAEQKQACESAVSSLEEKLGSCNEVADALKGKATAVCAIPDDMPQSCDALVKTQQTCLATEFKTHLRLSIERAKATLAEYKSKEEHCNNATMQAKDQTDKCTLLAKLIEGKKAQCSAPCNETAPCEKGPCNLTSPCAVPEPLNLTISTDVCDEYKAEVEAQDKYTGCYAAAKALAEASLSSAKKDALRMSLRYRQLQRLRCVLQHGDSPEELELCEENFCNHTVVVTASVREPLTLAKLEKPPSCCGDVCAEFACPRGYDKLNSTFPPEASVDACCKATCGAFTCPYGYSKKENSFAIRNFSTRNDSWIPACCDQTCGEFRCPANYDLKVEPFSIIGYCRFKCCDEGCGIFTCPAGTLKKTNLTGVRGFSPQVCCDRTCATASCPDGTELKENPGSIRSTEASECCKPTCKKFACPEGYRKKGVDISGYSSEECCAPTCATVTCPRGFVYAMDHAQKLNISEEECCEATCDAFTCQEGHVKKPDVAGHRKFTSEACCDETCDVIACPVGTRPNQTMAGVVPPSFNQTQACCGNTCSLFTCPYGYNMKDNANDIFGECQSKCCEEGCPLFACPPGMLKKDNLEGVLGFNARACCDVTCAGFQCPRGFQQVASAEQIRESSQDICCEQTCGLFECPAGYNKTSDAIKGYSVDVCCKPTCGAFTCPHGYNKKANAGSIYNFSLEGCCDQNCGEFLCPEGYDKKMEPFSILGQCKFKCCDEGCGLFTCPAGTVKKTNLTGVRGFSPQICCDKTCATVKCLNGTELKENPLSIKASTTQACCKPTCQKYACPEGYRKKGLDISGYSTEECCSATCDTVSCPRGFVKALDAATQRDQVDADSCCDATCDAFTCPDGHIKKPDVAGLRNFSARACCDETCDAVACPAGTRANHSMAGVVAPLVNKSSACCSKMCSLFSCPSGYNLKAAAADIEGECRFKCCDEGCGLFMCPPGTLQKENLTGLPGFSPQACCDMTCARFRCPQGFQQVEGAGDIREYSQDVCCEQTCGMFDCPVGYSKMADDIKGGTVEECCTMTCDLVSCQRGFVKKIQEGSDVLGVSHETCCEGTCDTFSCSAGSVKKSGVEGLRQFSEEACCDVTCDAYDCPDGYNLVASSGSILQLSTDTCCEKSCNLFTCPKGFLPVANSNISGFSRDACCEQTCTAVTCDHGCLFECPTGWMLKPDADNIRGGTASACCDMTCDSFWCPFGMRNKPNAETFSGNTAERCCESEEQEFDMLPSTPEEYCDTMPACRQSGYEVDSTDDACLTDVRWAKKQGIHEHPDWYPGLTESSSVAAFKSAIPNCANHTKAQLCGDLGCDDETCCKPTCATYDGCSKKGLLKDRAMDNMVCLSSKGCDDDTCCKPTCASMTTCSDPGNQVDVSDDAACWEAVKWAMTDGVLSNPEWYPGLSPRSSWSQFRAHLDTVDGGPCAGKLSAKVCPPGGCNDETCCKPTCASTQCTRPGFSKTSENLLCPPGGCTEDFCCKSDAAPKCVLLPERFMYCKSKTGTFDKPEVPLCVTLADGDASAGKLVLGPCKVGDASIDQQFVLNHTDSQIHWFKDPTKCLEVKVSKNGTVEDEASVTLADCQDPCEVREDPTKQGFCFDVVDGQYKVIKSSCFGEASPAAPAAFDTNHETPNTKCLQIKNGRAKEGWILRVSDCTYEETRFGKDHDQCWEYIDLYRKCDDCAPIPLPSYTGWTQTPTGGVDCIAQANGGQCEAQIGSNSSTSCGTSCCCDNHPWSCQTDSFTCGCYHTLMTCPAKKGSEKRKGSKRLLGKAGKGKGKGGATD